MATDTKKGVPGVPAAAIDAIQDENARIAIQALVDGWNVRNGNTGDKTQKFITEAEVGDKVNGVIVSGLDSTLGAGGRNNLGGLVQKISSILSQVQADVIASYEWQRLGQRIELIQIPALQSGITNETTTRVSSDNALVQAVNKLWATVGNNSALVVGGSVVSVNNLTAIASNWEQVQSTIKDPVTGEYVGTAAVRNEARTEANLVKNRLSGEYTVKIDLNGYVAGYGLFSNYDLTTGATTSSFGVRADRFFVGSAESGSQVNAVPFTVISTPHVINGVTRPPGVYITDAIIGNGSIGTAQIGDASVETLKIAGNAVTVPLFAAGGGGSYGPGDGPSTVVSVSGTFNTEATIVASAFIEAGNTGGATNIWVQMAVNGTPFFDRAFSLTELFNHGVAVTGGTTIPAGTYTFTLAVGNNWVSGGPWVCAFANMTVIGAKR